MLGLSAVDGFESHRFCVMNPLFSVLFFSFFSELSFCSNLTDLMIIVKYGVVALVSRFYYIFVAALEIEYHC